MDIPPIGNKPGSDLSSSSPPEDQPQSVTAVVGLQCRSSESSPRELRCSQRQVSIGKNSTDSVKSDHTWSNQEPLLRFAPTLTKFPPKKQGLRCKWNFQKDISELDLRPAIRKEVLEYIKLDAEQGEAWLNERMQARTYDGDEFPALRGQLEVRANRDIKPFEILGHYAGEINTE